MGMNDAILITEHVYRLHYSLETESEPHESTAYYYCFLLKYVPECRRYKLRSLNTKLRMEEMVEINYFTQF